MKRSDLALPILSALMVAGSMRFENFQFEQPVNLMESLPEDPLDILAHNYTVSIVKQKYTLSQILGPFSFYMTNLPAFDTLFPISEIYLTVSPDGRIAIIKMVGPTVLEEAFGIYIVNEVLIPTAFEDWLSPITVEHLNWEIQKWVPKVDLDETMDNTLSIGGFELEINPDTLEVNLKKFENGGIVQRFWVRAGTPPEMLAVEG